MNPFMRIVLILFSFVLAVSSLLFLLMMLSGEVLSGMILILTRMTEQASLRLIVIIFWLVVLVLSVLAMGYGIMSGRLHKTRIRNTDIGGIDIGVDAIESIALNAARAAQAGIKSAKARVTPFKGEKIKVTVSTVLFSDVEVPAMMAKVQDRIKKDVERFTGIQVGQVIVRVSQVEAVSARIEH